MTMPPQQPPGPYGPPPQQPPHPYGHQQFPQQQPYPGQPYPPQPYPPMGMGQMGPVGPPLPRKNRAGMVIGIVALSLVVLSVLGFVVNRLKEAGAVTTGAGFPEVEYRLTVPKTLLDGEYKLAQDMSQTQGKKALEGTYSSKIRNPKPVVGQYTSGSATELSVLVISGMYGQFKDPDSARGHMLGGAEDAQGATLVVPPKEIDPPGSPVTVSCQVLTSAQNGAVVTFPMCAWADGNTGASVAVVTPEISEQEPESVDLDKIAEITVKVREESLRKVG